MGGVPAPFLKPFHLEAAWKANDCSRAEPHSFDSASKARLRHFCISSRFASNAFTTGDWAAGVGDVMPFLRIDGEGGSSSSAKRYLRGVVGGGDLAS